MTGWKYFYPRPPRGGRPIPAISRRGLENFYPRPPRGGRRGNPDTSGADREFLSTPSARRATHKLYHTTYFNHAFLSTPSARRATFWVIRYLPPLIYFYPRPPRGGRHPLTVPLIELGYVFLSTPSVRRATDLLDFTELVIEISIHALREEGDLPTYERDGATEDISIHALREEGDLRRC